MRSIERKREADGPLLAVSGASRRNPTARGEWLFRDLGFALSPGDVLAILGPTGSGKTLLLRGIAGLDELEGGEMSLSGRSSADMPAPEWRAAVSYLHQTPPLPAGTVGAALEEPFGYREHGSREYTGADARAWLDAFGRTQAFLRRETEDLSGGERQLVALTRALLLEPRVLLLDEPTAALDPDTVERVEDALARWVHDTSERAMVWVTHDEDQAMRVAGDVVRLGPGTVG